MVTEKIRVSGSADDRKAALAVVNSFAEKNALTEKNIVHLRLLCEEMLGMICAVGGDFSADFWVEGDAKKCTLDLSAKTKMTVQKRQELLKLSTSGKNASAGGIMDRVREEMEIYLLSLEEGAEDSTGIDYGVETLAGCAKDGSEWKLSDYKGSVERRKDSERIAEWDALEKSIVANIADDVSVGIKNDKVNVIITKTF